MALRRALLSFSSRSFLFQRHGEPVDRFCSLTHVHSGGATASITVITAETQLSFSILRQQKHYSSSGSDGGAPEPHRQRGFFPRRAVMYVPASDERKTKKATTLSVDTLVFDLEDGVATNQKVCNVL